VNHISVQLSSEFFHWIGTKIYGRLETTNYSILPFSLSTTPGEPEEGYYKGKPKNKGT